ncbi:MAG: ADOP family duplicated permease [Terriglobia bacterium]
MMLSDLVYRLRALFQRNAVEGEMNEELRFHLEHEVQKYMQSGLAREEAQRQARLAFGGLDQAKEECRDARGVSFIETTIQDVRYGLRQLRRNPGFTAVAVLTLALGIGATTAIFSVINDTLLKPLPFPDANRLVLVLETFGKGPDNWTVVSAPNYWDFKRQNTVFEGIAIFDAGGRGYNLSAGSKQEPEQVSGLRVSASFFTVLGVKPLLGRTFLPEEEMPGKDHEVVLSYGLWKARYGANPALVGKTIKIDGEDFTVVGLMPPRFEFQYGSNQRQLWVPVGYTKTDYGRNDNRFVCFARLKPEATVAQARVQMEAIAQRLVQQYPSKDAGMGATVMPMGSFGLAGLRRAMLVLLAAVGFVLLIACVNVASLLLARGATRQKEFAIRRALGAQGGRLARQLLTESVLLALFGGASGLLLAAWSAELLPHVLRIEFLYLPLRSINAITLDGRVFGFALLVSCLAGVLSGLAPAFGAWRGDVNEPLKESGRGSTRGDGSRLRHALVIAEVALALVVLCGAGLMIESMARLLGVNPGLNPKNVLIMQVSVPQKDIYAGPPGLPRFCQQINESIGAVPGVMSVSAMAHLPFEEGVDSRRFQIEGRPAANSGHMPSANYSVACPNYFRTMGVPVLKGREFTQQDTLTSPGVIVINETMTRRYWPKQDPVGRAIRLGGSDGPRLIVVGVVGDVHHWGLDEGMRPQFFRPYTQAGWPVMSIVVRTTKAPATFAPRIKKALAEVLPDRPVSQVETMEDIVHDSTGSRRFPMILLSAFAFLALILAAVGIYGVVAYSVSQRTHEIGIRMALGAQKRDVLRLVVGQGLALVLIGVGTGIVAALGLTRLMASLLYGVKPTDPLTFIVVSLVLTAVALLACYIPARRATKVNPMEALRYE